MDKDKFLWDTFGVIPKEVKDEEEKAYEALTKRKVPYDEVISYLNYKKDLLLRHKQSATGATISSLGTIAASTTSLLSTGHISNICLGTAAIFLASATYNLVNYRKVCKQYNETNENLGLKFVKKM